MHLLDAASAEVDIECFSGPFKSQLFHLLRLFNVRARENRDERRKAERFASADANCRSASVIDLS